MVPCHSVFDCFRALSRAETVNVPVSLCAADYNVDNRTWPIMWNEFEVVDVQRFRQPDIAHFAAATDATDRLYTHRRAQFAVHHHSLRARR